MYLSEPGWDEPGWDAPGGAGGGGALRAYVRGATCGASCGAHAQNLQVGWRQVHAGGDGGGDGGDGGGGGGGGGGEGGGGELLHMLGSPGHVPTLTMPHVSVTVRSTELYDALQLVWTVWQTERGSSPPQPVVNIVASQTGTSSQAGVPAGLSTTQQRKAPPGQCASEKAVSPFTATAQGRPYPYMGGPGGATTETGKGGAAVGHWFRACGFDSE